MSFTSIMTPDDVTDVDSFCAYVQQKCGTPFCTYKDKAGVKRGVKELCKQFPHIADNPWPVLCRTVQWARGQHKRPATVGVVVWKMVAWAWADGALPELDPRHVVDTDVEEQISTALQECTDPMWRSRLLGSEGPARKEVLLAWQQRSSLSPAG